VRQDGGYLPGGTVPGPLLVRALNYIDAQIGSMVSRIQADGSGYDILFPAGTGAMGRAVSTRRPVATTNVLTDPRIALTPELRETLQSRPHRSALALPMIVDDRVVGAIAVGDHEGRSYDSDEVRLAQAFVDQAAMALEKARLFEDSERRRREAEIFAELASQITASLDLDTILRRVWEAARELCRADLGVIATRDSATQAMLIRHWPGASVPPVDKITPGEGLGGQVLLTGRPFRTDDYPHDPRLRNDAQPLTQEENVEAALAVPIQTEARVEGLLAVYNRSARPFTDRDEARLTRLAAQTAIAIRNAQLLEARRAYQARLEALLDVSHELSRIQPVEELLGFCAAYGFDLRSWEHCEVLLRVRELLDCSFALAVSEDHPGATQQIEVRVRAWLDPADRSAWTPLR